MAVACWSCFEPSHSTVFRDEVNNVCSYVTFIGLSGTMHDRRLTRRILVNVSEARNMTPESYCYLSGGARYTY